MTITPADRVGTPCATVLAALRARLVDARRTLQTLTRNARDDNEAAGFTAKGFGVALAISYLDEVRADCPHSDRHDDTQQEGAA